MHTPYTDQEALHKLESMADGAFICFASFEDRCLQSYNTLKTFQFSKRIILFFEEFLFSTERNKQILNKNGDAEEVMLKNGNPIFSVDVLLGIFSEFSRLNIQHILIDITCFNREILLMFLQIINAKNKDFNKIYFIYNSAKDMNKDFLSTGILDVHSVLGYGGELSPLKRDHLIVILGFEIERANKIIELYEPDRVTMAIGKKSRSINETLHRKNRDTLEIIKKNIAIGRYSTIPLDVVEIAIDDALEAKKDLDRVIKNYPEHNNIIAPLNTKLSTVGAGFCAMKNPSIQICYSQMAMYNCDDYSSPSNDFYIIDMKEHFHKLGL